jgi:RNA polymerase sigma factor (sigma-70 family)
LKTEDLTGLVHFVIAGLQKAGQLKGYDFDDADIQQEGYLAALEALPRVDAAQGKASTLLVPRIRGAILDYVATERNQGMASKRKALNVVSLNEDSADHCTVCDYVYDDEDAASLVDAFTYEDTLTGQVPDAFKDAQGKVLIDQLAYYVDRMDEPVRTTLLMHYGLLGYDAMTFTEVEQTFGIKAGTSYKRLTLGLTKLRNVLNVR